MNRASLHLGKVAKILFVASFLWSSSLGYGQPAEGPASKNLIEKLRLVEERTKKIEANQKEILTRQGEILQKLDEIKLWIVRR